MKIFRLSSERSSTRNWSNPTIPLLLKLLLSLGVLCVLGLPMQEVKNLNSLLQIFPPFFTTTILHSAYLPDDYNDAMMMSSNIGTFGRVELGLYPTVKWVYLEH